MSRFNALVAMGVLLVIGLCLALPLADPRASESDPYHTHIVLGAGSPEEVQRALALHLHGGALPISPDTAGEPTRQAQAEAGLER